MPGFKTNVKNLKAIAKSVKGAGFKEKALDIVDLYIDKKIKNIKTAEIVLLRLSQPRYHKSGQAEVAYQNVIGKYREAEPMTGRLERESLRKKVKTYSATMMLFMKTDEWDEDEEPDPTLLVETKTDDKDEQNKLKKT